MSALIATAHILGALIVFSALGVVVLAFAGWENERNVKAALNEISIALDIPVGELDNIEHQARVVQFQAAKFSSELLRNRLSDLCGWIRTGWIWLGGLVQVVILFSVIWYTVTDDLSYSVHAWWIIAVWLFFWLSSVLFALICNLLTGRFPGQARHVRKILAEVVKQQRADVVNTEKAHDAAF